jgi:hypothetical protein
MRGSGHDNEQQPAVPDQQQLSSRDLRLLGFEESLLVVYPSDQEVRAIPEEPHGCGCYSSTAIVLKMTEVMLKERRKVSQSKQRKVSTFDVWRILSSQVSRHPKLSYHRRKSLAIAWSLAQT